MTNRSEIISFFVLFLFLGIIFIIAGLFAFHGHIYQISLICIGCIISVCSVSGCIYICITHKYDIPLNIQEDMGVLE